MDEAWWAVQSPYKYAGCQAFFHPHKTASRVLLAVYVA